MNFYEQLVYDELETRGFSVFTSYKDRGVDCVVTLKNFQGRPQNIQVKESKRHLSHADGWYQFPVSNLEKSTEATDFWIFVCLTIIDTGRRFTPFFLVVPTYDLATRLKQYAIPSSNKYNLFISWNHPEHPRMVVDTRSKGSDPVTRGSPRDYSDYDGKWSLIENALCD